MLSLGLPATRDTRGFPVCILLAMFSVFQFIILTLRTWHTSMDVGLRVSEIQGPTAIMAHQENIISAVCNKDFLVVIT